jgi:hypothetical protein
MPNADDVFQGAPRSKFESFEAQITTTLQPKDDDEFERFINQRPSRADDPLQWWLEPTQQRDYPNLSRMAIDVLSAPPMSAESERVFSGARRTISWDRAKLGPLTIRQSECLKSWLAHDIAQSWMPPATVPQTPSSQTTPSEACI